MRVFLLTLLVLTGPVASAAGPSPLYSQLYRRYSQYEAVVPLATPRFDAPAVVLLPVAPIVVKKPGKAVAGITVSNLPTPKVYVAPLPASKDRKLQVKNGKATIGWLAAHKDLRTTSNNRSPILDSWAKRAGVALGSEWCGLTQMQAQLSQALPYPLGPAGSYNWHKAGPRLIFQQGKKGKLDSIQVGYKTGLYNVRKGRIAHIMAMAIVVRDENRRIRGFYTWAGNEGSGTKEGIHLTYYPATSIYASSNWNY